MSHMRAAKALLMTIGVLFVIGSIFQMTITTSRAHGRYELNGIVFSAVVILLCGVGFLLPQALAKLFSSVLLVGIAVRLFCIDAFRSENWWIYILFFIPLLLPLWILRKQISLPRGRQSNAN